MALTELAQQAGLPNSTTHRLLTTMQQLGFVRQVGELGHWAVGAHAFIVGSSFLQSRNLLAIVHPILRKLMEESGETVNRPYWIRAITGRLLSTGAVYAADAHVRTDWRQAANARLWRRESVSLAAERRAGNGLLHRKGLHAYTHATLVSPVHLKEDLALTRKRGYSFDDEEHALGLRCLASCILTSTASRLPPSPSPGRFHA